MKQQRKIKPTRCSVLGKIPFNGKSIAYESILERDFLIYHTFRYDVVDIIAQPVQLEFQKHGRTYFYTPDFFVEFDKESGLKPMLIEVKPEQLWQENWREWSNKWKVAMQYCKDNGYVFHIYDEHRIRHQALENINFLQAYKNFAIDKADAQTVLAHIDLMGTATIDYLLTRFYSGNFRPHGKRVIYCLLANKLLHCDLSRPIDDFSQIWSADYV